MAVHGQIISDDRYDAIAARVRCAPPGPIAEVGVAYGGVVSRLACDFRYRTVYAYDTFEGLPPEHWQPGEHHRAGEFNGGQVAYARLNAIHNVIVRKGLFPDTLQAETGFAVVHLDVDLYLATLAALQALTLRMAPGGCIILDDWDWPACPGVVRAVRALGLTATPTVPHQAVIEFPREASASESSAPGGAA
jgi:hypothetical protein